MDNQDVLYTKQGHIATMTLNRPDKMNALISGIVEGIYKGLEETVKDNEVRVLIITGTGRAFCAGADVKGMASDVKKLPGEKVVRSAPRLNHISLPLRACNKPIIAMVNGIAVGGGLDLALSCDIRIASDKAQFSAIYIRRGLVPVGGGTYFLPRLIGLDKACQMIWTGDMVDAKEAERIGLVTSVVPHEDLESETRELAEKIVKNAPLAVQAGKKAIYDGLDKDLETTLNHIDSIQQALMQTEDHKEGARAFVEKREPFFTGK